jgi:hypothetical protein
MLVISRRTFDAIVPSNLMVLFAPIFLSASRPFSFAGAVAGTVQMDLGNLYAFGTNIKHSNPNHIYCLVPIRCFPSRLPSPACIFFPIHTHSFLATPFHTHTSSRFLHKRTHTHTRIHAYTYELCCFARLWLCRRRTGPSISVQRCVDLQHDQADVGVSGMCGQMSPVTSIQPAAHPIIICNKSSCTHACTQHSI